MKIIKKIIGMIAVFLGCFYLPIESLPFSNPFFEAMALVKWYAREHILLCLIPTFFIAGAISIFVNKSAVVNNFKAKTNRFLAYFIASVSGVFLYIRTNNTFRLFSGIYKKGAGIGPAMAFLYSGAAINVLAIIMTTRVLGWQLGLARVIGSVLFSIVIGFLMNLIFKKKNFKRSRKEGFDFWQDNKEQPIWQNIVCLGAILGILIFATWAKPVSPDSMVASFSMLYWSMIALFLAIFMSVILTWYDTSELTDWGMASAKFALRILPGLLLGVFVAGFLLGNTEVRGIIPDGFIRNIVGGNSWLANFIASAVSPFAYFSPLSEVPILQGLISSGMGKGSVMAFLLAGPALSLPTILIAKTVLGTKKTIVYIGLVVIISTLSGSLFGIISE